MSSRWIDRLPPGERAALSDAGRLGRARFEGPPPRGSQLSAESRLIEYVAHEGNSDAQEDMAIVSDQITKMKLALHGLRDSNSWHHISKHAQNLIREALDDRR